MKAPPSDQARLRIAIIGVGQIGQLVARQLAANWRITLIDKSATALEGVGELGRQHGWRLIEADGTSRLALERAGLTDATALIATTGDDQVNRECARIAREALGIRRVLAVIHDPTQTADLTERGIEPILGSGAIATLAANRLERAYRIAEQVGLGMGEILEVTVEAASPVVGQTLRELRPRDWVVAAIYRDDRLIIPHGDTAIYAADRLLLVGQPTVLPTIAEYLRGGIPRFPLPYGRRLAALRPKSRPARFSAEVTYLAGLIAGGEPSSDAAAISGGLLTYIDTDRTLQDPLFDGTPLEKALILPGLGCLVLPPEGYGLLDILRFRRTLLREALERARCPILIPRGSFPYRRILLPVTARQNILPVARIGVGLARQLGASLTAVTVTPPDFVASPRALADQAQSLADAAAVAETHRLQIETDRLVGNPIHEVVELADDYDLVLLAHRPTKPGRRMSLRPDVGIQLAQRCRRTTLIVPDVARGNHVG